MINDEFMFKCIEKVIIDREIEKIKIYYVPYINQKGFIYLVNNILKYIQNNKINIFNKKITNQFLIPA